jgi:dTDP-glucose 4,6-dehydratase
MKLLVTSGAGFIGSNLVHYLLRDASSELGLDIAKVVTLDKLTYAGNAGELEPVEADPRHLLIQGDICDGNWWPGILRQALKSMWSCIWRRNRTWIARLTVRRSFVVTNVLGTFSLVWRVSASICGIPAGSQAPVMASRWRWRQRPVPPGFYRRGLRAPSLYGDAAFQETTPYAPNSPYSASKAGGDHLARAYFHTYGVPVVTTNCSNNYGPYQFPEKLLPLMIRKALRGEALPVYGDGGNIRTGSM